LCSAVPSLTTQSFCSGRVQSQSLFIKWRGYQSINRMVFLAMKIYADRSHLTYDRGRVQSHQFISLFRYSFSANKGCWNCLGPARKTVCAA